MQLLILETYSENFDPKETPMLLSNQNQNSEKCPHEYLVECEQDCFMEMNKPRCRCFEGFTMSDKKCIGEYLFLQTYKCV